MVDASIDLKSSVRFIIFSSEYFFLGFISCLLVSILAFVMMNCSSGKTGFWSASAIKHQRQLTTLTNPTMVCPCRSYFLDLPLDVVDFIVEGCHKRLHYVFQGEYVLLNHIDFDGG